ncbi:unnamed protein product [Ixodes pacificus]
MLRMGNQQQQDVSPGHCPCSNCVSESNLFSRRSVKAPRRSQQLTGLEPYGKGDEQVFRFAALIRKTGSVRATMVLWLAYVTGYWGDSEFKSRSPPKILFFGGFVGFDSFDHVQSIHLRIFVFSIISSLETTYDDENGPGYIQCAA